MKTRTATMTAVQALRAKRGHTAAVVKSMSEMAVYDVETLHMSLAGKITPALAERLRTYIRPDFMDLKSHRTRSLGVDPSWVTCE